MAAKLEQDYKENEENRRLARRRVIKEREVLQGLKDIISQQLEEARQRLEAGTAKGKELQQRCKVGDWSHCQPVVKTGRREAKRAGHKMLDPSFFARPAEPEEPQEVEPEVEEEQEDSEKDLELEKVERAAFHREDCTPIMRAVLAGQVDSVGFLLTQSAQVLDRDKNGQTPLILAVIKGNSKIVQVLLRGSSGRELLKRAATRRLSASDGQPKDWKREQVLAQDHILQSALFYAVKKGHRDIIDKLLDHFPEEQACTQDLKGLTPLMHLIISPNVEHLVKLLLEKGGREQVAVKDKDDRTALAHAVLQNKSDIVSQLLCLPPHGQTWPPIDHVLFPDKDGFIPLMHAVMKRNEEIVRRILDLSRGHAKKFLDEQVKFEDSRQQTAFMIAVEQDSHVLAKLLLEQDKEQALRTDRWGNTALILAVQKNNHDLVKAVLDAGDPRQVNMINDNKRTAVDVAKKTWWSERVLEVLYADQYGAKTAEEVMEERKPTKRGTR